MVVIEGAGSPAEINLRQRHRQHATWPGTQAACLLVTDIDRGGAFAHLLAPGRCCPRTSAADPRLLCSTSFRGDASLLSPGPADAGA